MGGDTKDLSRKHHSKGHPKEIVYQILELPRTTSLDPIVRKCHKDRGKSTRQSQVSVKPIQDHQADIGHLRSNTSIKNAMICD